MRFFAILSCALLCASLLSCTAAPTSIDRSLNVSKVVAYSNNSNGILQALAADAGFQKGTFSYYDLTEAGFNFVDDQCNGYFESLHDLEASRNATQRGLGAFGQTVTAIQAATGASTLSLAVVAQAFGLGQNLVNTYADSFLFSLPPSRTASFVSKVMSAYRNAAAEHQSSIDSGPAAYREIQGYLKLCTPVTIEAMLSEHIADATVQAVYRPGSTDLYTGTRTTAEQKVIIERTAPISGPLVKFKPTGTKADFGNDGINPDEAATAPVAIRKIQAMICVQPTGKWNAETRAAVVKLFAAKGDPRPRIATLGVSRSEMTVLQQGTQLAKPLKCGADAENLNNLKYTTVEELAQYL